MKEIDSGYSYTVDTIDKNRWHSLMFEFDDASFYQTWSYGQNSWGNKNLSHLLLYKDDEIVSLAQLRILKIPFLKVGIAYLTWGPMWKYNNKIYDLKNLRNMLRALYQEYVKKRGFLLKIIPKQIHENEDVVKEIFKDENFLWSPDNQQTVYVDLTLPIEEIKKNIRPRWRQTLKHALDHNLDFIEGTTEEICADASGLIKEMISRKKFIEFGSMENLTQISTDLPEPLKLYFIICLYEKEPVAVIGLFLPRSTGYLLVAATGDKALNMNASYPLYWKMIEFYKKKETLCIDLGGVNKEKNPGGYYFKTSLAGKKRKEKYYIGQFDACENVFSKFCFSTAMSFREHFRDFLVRLNKVSK
jgi:lipid II:glycine glycyltransferase (peptidoglycan interpeptide bridge formation enzyme)